jgi:hypothetical protein
MNDFYTYAYLREDRTPYYIGKGKDDRCFIKGKKENVHLPKDKSRIIFLKQNLTEEEAFKHEKYMIAVFGRKDNGTGILRNLTDGGEGSSGWVPSEETRIKWSEVHKGKILSEETKRKISEAQKGEKNHNYGKTLSEETRIKISEAQKGKTLSEETKRKMGEAKKQISKETKRKMSEAHKGKTLSEEHKRKISERTKNPSEETRRKISEARKGKKWWNDGLGNRKFVLECPGNGWKPGME